MIANMPVFPRSFGAQCCAATLAVTVLMACADERPAPAPEVTPAAQAAAVTLDLWSGLPPLEPHPGDLATLIEPRPGPAKPTSISETLTLEFPPKTTTTADKPEVTTGPLKVERFGPTGAMGLVDAVRVTFNQPMVPLASVEALATKTVPLLIEPAIAGKARWLGTRTVAFYPEARLAFSTQYKIRVPSGTVSSTGNKLAEDVAWTIETPTLASQGVDPYGGSTGHPLDQKVTINFNQPVQRVAVLAALRWKGRGKDVEFTAVEPAGAALLEPWQRDRIVVLEPKAKLAPNTTYTVSLPAGVFGEGPLRGAAIKSSFTTYPPLVLTKAGCDGPCFANDGIMLYATTPVVDPKLEDKIHISPAVEGLTISANYGGIQLGGEFLGDTTYKVTVDAGLLDAHGQTLAKPFTTTVRLGPYYASLALANPTSAAVVIESGATRELGFKIAGLTTLEVQAASFGPAEIPTFLGVRPDYEDWSWPSGTRASNWSKSFGVAASRTKRQDFELGLDELLGDKSMGWLIARSNAIKSSGSTWRAGVSQFVMVTDLGIAVVMDGDSAVFLVTRLSDGAPVEGASVSFGEAKEKPLWTGSTDVDGRARATFVHPSSGNHLLVTVEHQDDAAFLRLDSNDLRGRWHSWGTAEDQPQGFFFTERAPYKPGETIHLVGVLRQQTRGPKGGVVWWRANSTAKYKVVDPRGVDVASGEVKIGPFGTFTVDIPTKPDGGTGDYRFTLDVPRLLGSDQTFYHSIPVETFRTPEFTVKVERPDSKPLVFGEALTAEICGEYLHGAPLVGGEVAWTLTRTETEFRPPGSENDAFTFGSGSLNPWGYGGFSRHRGRRRGHGGFGWGGGGAAALKNSDGVLDVTGKLVVEHIVLAKEPPPVGTPATIEPAIEPTPGEPEPISRAATYTLAATVTDENRQAIAGSGSFMVHPARVYVGLRSERSVVREGETTNLEAVAVDLEGARADGHTITVDFIRRETTRTPVETAGSWNFEYKTIEVRVGGCALVSAAMPQACAVSPDQAGTYVARASTVDPQGHSARSEITLYVHGKADVIWDDSSDRRVDLVADKRKYSPGDTAKILLRSPFAAARGFVVVEREGIAAEIPVVVAGGAQTVEIAITDEMVGGVTLSALLTRGRAEIAGAPVGQDLGIPAAAVGQLELDVVTDSKTIAVALEPHAKEIEPKGSLSLTIRTTRKDSGAALPAAVAVMVVDEGVLSLMDFKTPDPVAFFHTKRSPEVWMHALHPQVQRRDVADLATLAESSAGDDKDVWGGLMGTEISEAYGTAAFGLVGTGLGGGGTGEGTIGLGNVGLIGKGGGGGSGSGYGRGSGAGFGGSGKEAAPSPAKRKARSRVAPGRAEADAFDPTAAMAQGVSLRTVFATTAFFDAEIQTDENGEARIDIPMPENLTTFRIMAVAVDPAAADRFGSGESTVRVRKPVMIRPSLPRFANFGDKFEGSVMVDNQTGDPQKVLVGARGLNVVFGGATETFVEIPAGESREVRFDMAVEKVGTMRLQFAAMSNGGRDATEVTIPVHYPATAKAFADYGMTDESVQRTIEPPNDALPGFGGLELSFSSTALSGLQDAVSYLVDYPYECAEQTASRILPIFALGDVLDAFPIATVRDKALRDEFGREGIAKLLKHQLPDGGFGYWAADESWPYLTNWVTFALLEGKRRGYEVNAEALDRSLNYLENFVAYGYRSRWGDYYDWTSRAFGLWLMSGEKRGASLFDTVWAHRKDMPLYARVLLMSAAHRYGRTSEREEIRAELEDVVIESARTIHFAESKSEAASDGLRLLMHSSAQTDAVVLMALLEIDPGNTMLPKIIAGIMDDRDPKRGGRWISTHANAWSLVAASRYFEVVEKDEPDYTAQVWIDELFAGEHAFKGRSMAKVDQKISMQTLQGAPSRELTLAKTGLGKLYYRIGLRYAPKDLKLKATDQGFTVYRQYEALPGNDGKVDPDAVKQTEDGDWIVKAATNVKVTISLVVSDRANYVVVDDPLPAGFEGQNPKFVTSVGASSGGSGRGGDPGLYGGDGWWWGWWYTFSHTDLRDDRMLLFADQLPAGVYTYSYTARATTIGEFLLPPVKAEEMYEPERFGHGSSARVSVVE